ncbi:MAG: ISL3 family transposase [Minicystis sp.]
MYATATETCCPTCGQAATRVHSRYQRVLADLPCQGVPVEVRATVRRFRCDETTCARAIFTERLPALARPHARRTARQAEALKHMAIALGGEAAARLSSELALGVSADTLLRIVRRAEIGAAPPPHIIGVDDWAIRRGHEYGTILVDLERHAPIDLLPDRTAESLNRWLNEHPGIEIVARDRSDTYAQGARAGAPDAVQVADRWHLLKNAGDALERVAQRNRAALQRAATDVAAEAATSTDATLPAVAREAGASTEAQKEGGRTAPPPRQALYERHHTLRARGPRFGASVS